MSLKPTQIAALADAHAETASLGLQRYGAGWYIDRPNATRHDGNTIRSLVDRGMLQLYAGGGCAHITELGEQALTDFREANP